MNGSGSIRGETTTSESWITSVSQTFLCSLTARYSRLVSLMMNLPSQVTRMTIWPTSMAISGMAYRPLIKAMAFTRSGIGGTPISNIGVTTLRRCFTPLTSITETPRTENRTQPRVAALPAEPSMQNVELVGHLSVCFAAVRLVGITLVNQTNPF
jgi:hypothetical protein